MTRALAFCIALFLASAGSVLAADPKTTLFVEVDRLEGGRKLKPKLFKKWYADANFKVRGVAQKHRNQLPSNPCATVKTVHDLIVATKSHGDLPPAVWYAHGLVLPHKYMKEPGGVCETMQGLFFRLRNDSGEIGHREAFVVFDGNFTSYEWKERAYTAAHELAHVLNTHHCEFDADKWGNYDAPLGQYIKKHLFRRYVDEQHVRPGGELWCSSAPHHRATIHGPQCSAGVEECCGASCDVHLAPGGTGAVLIVEPERQRYFPGEPIHVDLTLEVDGTRRDLFYDEGSLSEVSGMLAFSVGESPDTVRTLTMPLLAKRRSNLILMQAGDSFHKRDVGFWFSLPPEWYEWDERPGTVKTLSLIATHTLFAPSRRDPRRNGKVFIHSEPIEIQIGLDDAQQQLFHPEAHELFAHWQSRRFVWLGGSHVLPVGRRNLEQIIQRFPETIYAVYAELALGENCDPPPLTRDNSRERIRRCSEAQGHLQNARTRRAELAPSYRRRLDEALIRVGRGAVP